MKLHICQTTTPYAILLKTDEKAKEWIFEYSRAAVLEF
jgi:hypothetical protein